MENKNEEKLEPQEVEQKEVTVENNEEKVQQEEPKEPVFTEEQKQKIADEMKKINKVSDCVSLMSHRNMKDYQMVGFRAAMINAFKHRCSGQSMKDITEYGKKTNKTLLEMIAEIQEKKSPLSAMARTFLIKEHEANELLYVAIATLVESGLDYAEEALEEVEVEEVN